MLSGVPAHYLGNTASLEQIRSYSYESFQGSQDNNYAVYSTDNTQGDGKMAKYSVLITGPLNDVRGEYRSQEWTHCSLPSSASRGQTIREINTRH